MVEGRVVASVRGSESSRLLCTASPAQTLSEMVDPSKETFLSIVSMKASISGGMEMVDGQLGPW